MVDPFGADDRTAEETETWCQKWAPACPDGNPQRLRHALGFRERKLCELELRIPLGPDDQGVCQVVVDEGDVEVTVRVLLCFDESREEGGARRCDYVDAPVRVWLERPLGERAVVDVDTNEELALYKPGYLNGIPQPDAGYSPANRRGSDKRT
jgi:hypothetical protein